MAAARKKSPSGFWKVDLARRFTLHDFNYMPGDEHTVDQATLEAMRAEDGLILKETPVPAEPAGEAE